MEKRGLIILTILLVAGFFISYYYQSYKAEQQEIDNIQNSYPSNGWNSYCFQSI